jgi:hypothetical protein
VPGEAPGAEVESCQEFQQIEQHAKIFVYLLLQLNEHRLEWDGVQQAAAQSRVLTLTSPLLYPSDLHTQVRKSVKKRPNKVSNETLYTGSETH